jgi:hypothetical protein
VKEIFFKTGFLVYPPVTLFTDSRDIVSPLQFVFLIVPKIQADLKRFPFPEFLKIAVINKPIPGHYNGCRGKSFNQLKNEVFVKDVLKTVG